MTDAPAPSLTDPNSAPAPTGAPNAGDPAPAAWYAALPEAMRTDPGITRYDSIDKFASAKLGLDKHFGAPAEEIVRWPKADDKDGFAKLYDRLGRPEKADGYELPAPPEGMADLPDDMKQAAMAKFHEIGLTKSQAAELWAYQNEIGLQTQTGMQGASQAEQAAGVVALKTEWGGQFDARVAMAQDYIAKNAGADVIKFLDDSGLGQHPGVFKLVGNLVAKLTPSGGLPGAGAGGGMTPNVGGMTPGEASAQIDNLRGDRKFQEKLNDPAHEGHAQAAAQWRNLMLAKASAA
jgi:hypothetical protein